MKKLKPTKKLDQERIEFNQKYRKGQPALTIDQYINYLTGKGLPETIKPNKSKPLGRFDLPSWANDCRGIPSVTPSDHIPLKNSIMNRLDQETDEVKQAILKKKNQIALPYSKGAYQYVSDPELATCLGRKL